MTHPSPPRRASDLCAVAISAACSPKSGGKTMNKGLLVAASMVAVIAAMPAQAQEAAAIEAAGEIVVTAQKRVQNVQDVPISIRSEERRVGEECVRTCRTPWSQDY